MKHIKKVIALLIALTIFPCFLTANPRNEVFLGYGYPKSVGITFISGFTDFFTILFSGGTNTNKTVSPGIAQIGYNRFLTDKIAVGGTFTAEPFNMTNTSEGGISNTTHNALFTIQGNFKYQYGWEWVRLYHGVRMGLGLTTNFDDGSVTPSFAFDLIPIGIKIGKIDGFNFYADVGLWTTALFNAGVTYTF